MAIIEPTNEQTQKIGDVVVDAAYGIFSIMDRADDFSIQYIGVLKCVFGSTNRIIWDPIRGFRPDKSYCTKEFLNKWKTRIDRDF